MRGTHHWIAGPALALAFAGCAGSAPPSLDAQTGGGAEASTSLAAAKSPAAQGISFEAFLQNLEQEAKRRGLPAERLRASYDGPPAPLPETRRAEKNQPELQDAFQVYTKRAVSGARVAQGQKMLETHSGKLNRIARDTGVPAPLIVALWGMESNYGSNTGSLPLIPTLVSQAYQSHRAAMFRREVFAALQLPNAAALRGSWAGATGQNQFLPSNVLAHAVDGNSDGRVDIWHTEADVFASTANFLKHLGYQPDQPWRWPVQGVLDMEGLDVNTRGLSDPLPLAEWRRRGLVTELDLPDTAELRFYQPLPSGPQWLVGTNYEAILGWNYSSFFATSVFMLAEAIEPYIYYPPPR